MITISRFGEWVSQQAWLLVQHADHDIEFQKHYLKLMETALEDKDIRPENYAYLWDRVQKNSGQPQRYGTQGDCRKKNQWEPYKLEDPLQVNYYRQKMGLEPFNDYKKMVSALSCL